MALKNKVVVPGRPTIAPMPDDRLLYELYRRHRLRLLSYVGRLIGDWSNAEDIVQEVFVRAWRHGHALTGEPEMLYGWLKVVAHNLIVDRVRARQSRPTEVQAFGEHDVETPDTADAVAGTLVVQDLLSCLSYEKRAVIYQLFFRGASVNDAAAELQIPAGTVKSRAHRALRDLRAMAGADLGSEVRR
ncbi:sigma-70 family RNA polymerase sigma factor [Actinokineospora sp. HUAS TT18]|uniref:sigma-70 family RNA polymerase sigma factor n=1 Tax=Actinokineospora sp. HUAS TT18 TaxID=3447451 RepID=UPI003F51CAFC